MKEGEDDDSEKDKLPNWESKEKLFFSKFEKTLVGIGLILGSK